MYWEGLAKPQGIEGAGETILEESDLEESEARRWLINWEDDETEEET